MLTCTKTYVDIPFAHRAPKHDGHCRLIHGHNWSFTITFLADKTDECGFVVDFGKLKDLRDLLNATFDHKLVLNNDDPLLADFTEFLKACGIENVVGIPDCSCEGIAKFVFDLANAIIHRKTDGRVWVSSVTIFEDSKNRATYLP